MGIFHRDIKPGNLYVINDKTTEFQKKMVLIDFAFSINLKFSKRYKGTRSYMPEEMKLGDKKSDWYNSSIDVYSLASTVLKKIVLLLVDRSDVDLGLLYILESMLDFNHCFF